MKNNKKKNKKQKDCLCCDSCIPIGEGDHFCDEMLKIVIEDYAPNENFCCCLDSEEGDEND